MSATIEIARKTYINALYEPRVNCNFSFVSGLQHCRCKTILISFLVLFYGFPVVVNFSEWFTFIRSYLAESYFNITNLMFNNILFFSTARCFGDPAHFWVASFTTVQCFRDTAHLWVTGHRIFFFQTLAFKQEMTDAFSDLASSCQQTDVTTSYFARNSAQVSDHLLKENERWK